LFGSGRGSEAGSYLRPIDCVYRSTLGLRVIKKRVIKKLGSTSSRESNKEVGEYCQSKMVRTSRDVSIIEEELHI